MNKSDVPDRPPGTAWEVFAAFAPLGVTAFGGPVAHLAYFRTVFVARRGWLSDAEYADLVALCQFMPGPASSQVGMALGLKRAGALGMLAAFTAFTLPAAVAMAAFGLSLSVFTIAPDAPWLLGLKAAAVAVVANALLGMAGTLAGTARTATIAAAAMVIVLLLPDRTAAQLGVIALGALAGAFLPQPVPASGAVQAPLVGRRVGLVAGGVFVALLFGLPFVAQSGAAMDLFDRIYRAGALVFGGGHVVLPLLEGELDGLVDRAAFLAGYGAVQAMPGPLFTFAAYLGAVATPFGGIPGAVVATVAIFLPGALLLVAALPFWERLRAMSAARRVLAGVNAAVVGLLAAAFYDPVITGGIGSVPALCLAVAAFVALHHWKAPPFAVVAASGLIGALVL
ncbi:MAG: chromate efflux transporter [Pseudomonadota bacterium]